MEKHDIAIIGAGPAGYVAAIYAARLGKKVAVIEKDRLGGACLNRGCIPTKTLLSSIRLLSRIKTSSSFGIDITSHSVDFTKINSRKDEVVAKLRQGIETLFKARKITVVKGSAVLSGERSVSVGGEKMEAENIITATGSSPLEIPAFRFDHKNIISSDDILELKEIPQSLIIIGGGAIGCEFATIYNALGSKITIIEMMEEILPNMDKEVAKKLNLTLTKRGIEILAATKVEQIKSQGSKISAILSSGKEVLAEKALVCVGRRPNLENMGIESSGIKTDKGRIVVNEYMQTNIPNIYAAGDVAGKFQLAHVASYEGIVACENIFGRKKTADYKSVPACVYTDPEIASVGMTEKQAKDSGLDIKIARFPFSALGKAHAIGETEGFVKLIGDKKTDQILGVHIMGAEATDLIAEAVLAIKKGLKVEELGDTIHAHPTLAEALMEASHIFEDKGIHVL